MSQAEAVLVGIRSFITRPLAKGSFTRSVLTLMTGTAIAQAITIAISPILTRMYSPDDFGVFALYIAVVGFVAVVVYVFSRQIESLKV